MKRRELNELKQKSVADIAQVLAKKNDELFKVTKDLIEGKESNLRKKATIRREIAQILTIKGIIEREEKNAKKTDKKTK